MGFLVLYTYCMKQEFMKTINNIIELIKIRRNSDIDYNNKNYSNLSFFRVLLFKLKYGRKKKIKGTFIIGRDVVETAPLSYLLSYLVFTNSTGRIMMLCAINKEGLLSRF